MNSENFGENLLRRYLLGELTADECARVEDAAFADAETLALVQTTENDLIDEYARGELSAVEKHNFERMFLTSAERKTKIEFARTFAESEEKKIAPSQIETSAPQTKGKGFWQTLSGWRLQPQLAFGALALLVLLVGGSLIFFNSRKNDTEIVRRENANGAPSPQTPNQAANDSSNRSAPNFSPPSSVETSPAPEKSNQNKPANIQPTPMPAAPPPIKNAPAAPTFATLFFSAGMTRGGGESLQLKLSPNVKNARFVFDLEKGDEYKTYEIELRNKSGALVTKRRAFRAATRGITINVPAAKLPAGNYEAVLRGIADENQGATIGYYDFEIVKP